MKYAWIPFVGAFLCWAAVSSCGSTRQVCSVQTCAGCCDSTGTCQSGLRPSNCGAGGSACVTCQGAQACTNGQCTGGSAGGCSASNCPGCCDAQGQCHNPGVGPGASAFCGQMGASCTACANGLSCNANGQCSCGGCFDGSQVCQPGNDPAACGNTALACNICQNGATCQNGACTGGCNPQTCPTGCCNGATCVPFAQMTSSLCNQGGNACASCIGGASCVATSNGGTCSGGTGCNGTNCAAGCCDPSSGACVTNQNNTQCGTGGATCAACSTGQTCMSGSCQGGCSASCPNGCCSNGICTPYASQNANSCGSQGAACMACPSGDSCTSGVCVPNTACSQFTVGGTPGVVVLASLNTLPTPWSPANLAPFKNDDTGAANQHIGDLIQVTGPFTITNNPCPNVFSFTSMTSMKTFCDGVTIADSAGNVAYIDTFAYFGTANTCGGMLFDAGYNGDVNTLPNVNGKQLASVRGIWQDHYDMTKTPTDTWVIAPADCTDIALSPDQTCGGGMGTGCTNTPPQSCDVNAMLSGTPTVGTVVTVRGIVTGKWTGKTGTWGGVLQDSMSGNLKDAVQIHHGADGGFAGTAPNVGDYAKVTGTLVNPGGTYWEIQL